MNHITWFVIKVSPTWLVRERKLSSAFFTVLIEDIVDINYDLETNPHLSYNKPLSSSQNKYLIVDTIQMDVN